MRFRENNLCKAERKRRLTEPSTICPSFDKSRIFLDPPVDLRISNQNCSFVNAGVVVGKSTIKSTSVVVFALENNFLGRSLVMLIGIDTFSEPNR